MEKLYAIYRITRVVLLLSNKSNKSSKVLLELSKESQMGCFALLLAIPWTHPYKTLFTHLKHQPAALQGTVPSLD